MNGGPKLVYRREKGGLWGGGENANMSDNERLGERI